MRKFTKDKAIMICERKLPRLRIGTGYDCYYHDGRCELGLECNRRCMYYIDDISFTNMVRRNILENPEWCKEYWSSLCEVDKELFISIYGGGVF